MADNVIWYRDLPYFLTNSSNFFKIIPDRSMTLTEQLNAIMRFALYFTIVVMIIKQDLRVIFFLVFVGIITWIIDVQDNVEKKLKEKVLETLNIQEDIKKRPCFKPTQDNPFMNVTYADYTDFPNRPAACDVSKKDVEKTVNSLFEDGFIRATDDIYNRTGADRQFYTNAATTIPNDQNSFTQWCYKMPKTIKEDGLTNYFTPFK